MRSSKEWAIHYIIIASRIVKAFRIRKKKLKLKFKSMENKKFNPFCVKVGRESRGLNIAELAKSTTISAGKISKIEKGTLEPSIAEIQQFATVLRYPVIFFYNTSLKELNKQTHNGKIITYY